MPVDAVSETETIFLFHQHLPPYVGVFPLTLSLKKKKTLTFTCVTEEQT